MQVKSKVMVMNVEEGFECKFHKDRICNSNIWDVFSTNYVEMGQNVVGR